MKKIVSVVLLMSISSCLVFIGKIEASSWKKELCEQYRIELVRLYEEQDISYKKTGKGSIPHMERVGKVRALILKVCNTGEYKNKEYQDKCSSWAKDLESIKLKKDGISEQWIEYLDDRSKIHCNDDK